MSQQKNIKKINNDIKSIDTITLSGTSYLVEVDRVCKTGTNKGKSLGKGKVLVVKQEVLDAFDKERLRKRKEALTSPARLLGIEIEEALLNSLKALKDVLTLTKNTACISQEDLELLDFLKTRCRNLHGNILHKRDRIARPEVYSDINNRYSKYKRKKKTEKKTENKSENKTE